MTPTSETPSSVDLGPVAETLLIPLYGRAVLTRRGSPLIDDPAAVAMVDAIDWDFGRFDSAPSLLGSVLRTRWFDLWAADWLDRHPGGTVVELGAGLNTRAERLDRPGANWIDVDLPDAMALRGRFVPEATRRRQMAASATEPAWAEAAAELPGPWLVLADAPPALSDLLDPDDRAAYDTAGQGPQARSYRLNRYTVR